MIALRLRRSSGDDAAPEGAEALRPIIDRLLELLGQVITSIDPERGSHDVRTLTNFRTSFSTAVASADIQAIGRACLPLCTAAVEDIASQQADRQAEMRRLLAMLRDTVKVLSGDGDAFSSDVSRAADDFNALLHISDVTLLKAGLADAVTKLQTVAADRQKQWQETVTTFDARIQSLEAELVATTEEANRDPLTGVANRRGFEQAFRQHSQAVPRQFVLAMFDLDNFKRINDTQGHSVGDEVLIAIAKVLRSSVRENDVVARLGGDEFALIAATTLRQAESRLKAILVTLGQLPLGPDGGWCITVSCGLVEYCAGDTRQSMLQRADEALYEAKGHGKNRLVVKSPPYVRDLR